MNAKVLMALHKVAAGMRKTAYSPDIYDMNGAPPVPGSDREITNDTDLTTLPGARNDEFKKQMWYNRSIFKPGNYDEFTANVRKNTYKRWLRYKTGFNGYDPNKHGWIRPVVGDAKYTLWDAAEDLATGKTRPFWKN